MLVNSKNSQDCYVGLWVYKGRPLTQFEKYYNMLQNIPYQLVVYNMVVENPNRVKMENMLDNYKGDVLESCDAQFCECL